MMVRSKVGAFSPGMTQLSLQIGNLTLQILVMLCMGDMTFPTSVTFGGMSCVDTPLTVFSPFGTPMRITMLGAP